MPVAQKPRQVPYYLQGPLRKWLDQSIAGDSFEKLPDDEPVTWCSSVVVHKPKFAGTPPGKLESHMIIASVDLRFPNQHMERSRILQAPLLEDFTHKFHNCTICTKLRTPTGISSISVTPRIKISCYIQYSMG